MVRLIHLCLLFAVFAGLPVQAQTPWFQGWPTPSQVRADIERASQGERELVVAARQMGRFNNLAEAMLKLSGTSRASELPRDVQPLFRQYREEAARISATWDQHLEPIDKGCSRFAFIECRRATFYNVVIQYAGDEVPTRELADLYFDGTVKEAFLRAALRPGRATDLADHRGWRGDGEPVTVGGILRGIIALWPFVLVLMMLAAIVWGFRYWVRKLSTRVDRRRPLTDNHGSAQWAEMNMNVHPLAPVQGVFLGKYAFAHHEDGQVKTPPVFTKPEAHTLIVAPTRTGKGTRIIVPTLLRYMNSMLVIDPKGENAAITARHRAMLPDHRVHILNPWGVLDSELQERGFTASRYNPLDAIRRDDPDASSIAQTMAETICARSESKESSYWEGNAATILTAVFLWLADQPQETKTLARTRQIVTLPLHQLEREFFIPMAANSAFGGAIAESIGPFLSGESRDMPSILRTLAEATRFISDERLKAATADSDFDLRTFPHRAETVFLVVPPDKMKVQGTWLRLMIAAFTDAFRKARPRGQVRGMMLIDELPALGRIPDLPTDLATMSGYGLDYTLIVQDVGQLEAIYDKKARTIMANCAWKWMCNVRDYDTAKYVSDTLGQRTIATATVNEGSGTSGTTYGEMGRSLLTPDEVMRRLGRDRAIVLPPEGRPYQVWGVDYWRILDEFQLYADTSMKVYYQPRLAFDPNPYHDL